MHVSNSIDCNGLSTAPTVLRIKQALAGLTKKDFRLRVLVGSKFDLQRVERSLGASASNIFLATNIKQFSLFNGKTGVANAARPIA